MTTTKSPDAPATSETDALVREGLAHILAGSDPFQVASHNCGKLADLARRLERQRDALRNALDNLQPGPISEALTGQRYETESRLRGECDRLREYAQHKYGCDFAPGMNIPGAGPCSCGLDALLTGDTQGDNIP